MNGPDESAGRNGKRAAETATAPRAQTELPAVAIAFVLLTAVLVLAISIAGSALSASERPALEQQAAVSLSEGLTSEHATVTRRANVLDEAAVTALTDGDLDRLGVASAHDVRVVLDGETVLERGDPEGGATVERLVVVQELRTEQVVPGFTESRAAVIPHRTEEALIEIEPTGEVRSVSANDRLVLYNESGLRGEFTVSLSRYETKELTFEATGELEAGDVRITYTATESEKATLAVTVDA